MGLGMRLVGLRVRIEIFIGFFYISVPEDSAK